MFLVSFLLFTLGVLDGPADGSAPPSGPVVSLSESELLIMLEIISNEASAAVDQV